MSELPPVKMPSAEAREHARGQRDRADNLREALYQYAIKQSVRPHGPSSLRDEWAMFAEVLAALRVPAVFPEPDPE